MIKRYNVEEAVEKMCPDIKKRMKMDPMMGRVVEDMIKKVADVYNQCEEWEEKAQTAIREKDAFREALSKYSKDGVREVTETEKALRTLLWNTMNMIKAIEMGDVEYQEHLAHSVKKAVKNNAILKKIVQDQ